MGLRLTVVRDAQPKRVAGCRRYFDFSRSNRDDNPVIGLHDIALGGGNPGCRHQKNQRAEKSAMEK